MQHKEGMKGIFKLSKIEISERHGHASSKKGARKLGLGRKLKEKKNREM